MALFEFLQPRAKIKTKQTVRISAIVDARFSLIVDGETA
nr:hypothetical protein [uncultured bacterium]